MARIHDHRQGQSPRPQGRWQGDDRPARFRCEGALARGFARIPDPPRPSDARADQGRHAQGTSQTAGSSLSRNRRFPSDAQVIEKKSARRGQSRRESRMLREKPKQPRSGQADAQTKKIAEVGPAIGENKATPVARITAPEGFEVELLYSVPGGEQGSWVNLCSDDKGRIYASDQYGGLYRFLRRRRARSCKPGDVQKVPADIRAVNGMLFAFGALYVGVNDYEQKIAERALPYHRQRWRRPARQGRTAPRDGSQRRSRRARGRARRPDGKGLYLVCGNNADPHRGCRDLTGQTALGRRPPPAAHARWARPQPRSPGSRRHHLPGLARRQRVRNLRQRLPQHL